MEILINQSQKNATKDFDYLVCPFQHGKMMNPTAIESNKHGESWASSRGKGKERATSSRPKNSWQKMPLVYLPLSWCLHPTYHIGTVS